MKASGNVFLNVRFIEREPFDFVPKWFAFDLHSVVDDLYDNDLVGEDGRELSSLTR